MVLLFRREREDVVATKNEENEATRKRNQLEPIFKSYAKKACAFAMKAIEERFDLYISNNNK